MRTDYNRRRMLSAILVTQVGNPGKLTENYSGATTGVSLAGWVHPHHQQTWIAFYCSQEQILGMSSQGRLVTLTFKGYWGQ